MLYFFYLYSPNKSHNTSEMKFQKCDVLKFYFEANTFILAISLSERGSDMLKQLGRHPLEMED